MNKHTNRNKVPATPVQNRKQTFIDGMPPQVALEMLCTPGARLTARQRKVCWAARSKVFESTLEKKSVEAKLANRMQRANWSQIAKWTTRAERRGALLESAYAKALSERHDLATMPADRKHDNTKVQARLIILDKIIAALELKRANLMTFCDAIRLERERRSKFVSGLKKVAPTIAKALEPVLIGVASAPANC